MIKNQYGTGTILNKARENRIVIPGFNIPYLPMMEPVIRALHDTSTFGLIMVARLEWIKFKSGSMKSIRDEYEKLKDLRYTRLHLDHVPVIDEDNLLTNFESIITEAIELGYDSVMIDGSRLSLADNIEATRKIALLAHSAGTPIEAELGAVMGHESGPLPPYEELFASGKGFTSPQEAKRFVEETQTDWLSVAIGNIHGAISAATRTEKKIEARLAIPHLKMINETVNIPLVLHGGTGIAKEYLMQSFKQGIYRVGCDLTRKLYKNDRILSPLIDGIQFKLPVSKILQTFAFGLCFGARDENGNIFAGDIEFSKALHEKGLSYVLNNFCGLNLTDDRKVIKRILSSRWNVSPIKLTLEQVFARMTLPINIDY